MEYLAGITLRCIHLVDGMKQFARHHLRMIKSLTHDGIDGHPELTRIGVFQYVSLCAAAQHPDHRVLIVVHGQGQYMDQGIIFFQP
jgi:hypothetical protein